MANRDALVFVGACGCMVAAQVIPAASPADRGRFVAEHAEWGDPQVWTSAQVRAGRVWCGRCRPPGSKKRLPSRACTLCAPAASGGCVVCMAISEHEHLAKLARDGSVVAHVPLCRSCTRTVHVGGVAGGKALRDVLSGSVRAARERADA